VDVDFEQLDERSPENVAMVVVKYLQMLPEQLVTNKYEQHFRLALRTLSSLCTQQVRANIGTPISCKH